MKLITFILGIFLVSSNSCGTDPPFDAISDQRSFVTGQVINSEGGGIADFDVVIRSYSDIIGVATTGSDGYFEAVVLDDLQGTRWLAIEPLENDPNLTDFRLNYRFDDAQGQRSYHIDPVQVSNVYNLEVILTENSSVDQPSKLIFKNPSCTYWFQNDILESSYCFNEEEDYIFSDTSRVLQVPSNTEVIIRIFQNGTSTDYTYFINQDNYEILLTI
jgi:hypothetical protein